MTYLYAVFSIQCNNSNSVTVNWNGHHLQQVSFLYQKQSKKSISFEYSCMKFDVKKFEKLNQQIVNISFVYVKFYAQYCRHVTLAGCFILYFWSKQMIFYLHAKWLCCVLLVLWTENASVRSTTANICKWSNASSVLCWSGYGFTSC